MSHPPGAVFHARLLDNQDGPNTKRHVFGKFSTRCLQRRPFRHRHVEISSMGNRSSGMWYTPSSTVRCVWLTKNSPRQPSTKAQCLDYVPCVSLTKTANRMSSFFVGNFRCQLLRNSPRDLSALIWWRLSASIYKNYLQFSINNVLAFPTIVGALFFPHSLWNSCLVPPQPRKKKNYFRLFPVSTDIHHLGCLHPPRECRRRQPQPSPGCARLRPSGTMMRALATGTMQRDMLIDAQSKIKPSRLGQCNIYRSDPRSVRR